MNDWPTLKIRDVAIGVFDGPHATPPLAEDGPIFLGIGNVTEDGHLDFSSVRHIAEEDYAHWTKRVIPTPGDVVFTYEATLNRYAIIPEGFRGCLGRRMALIRPNPKKIDTRFLFYSMFSSEWRQTIEANRLTGATVDRIPIKKFPDFPIRVPPLETQRRIAAILGAYDDLIEVNRRRVAVLEEMARGLFEEHARAVDEKALLFDVASVGYGKNLPKSQLSEDGPYPVYGASKIIGRHTSYTHEKRTILVGCRGTVGEFQISQPKSFVTNNSFTILPHVETDFAWLFFALRRRGVADTVSGSAQPQITLQGASRVELLYPAAELRKRFHSVVFPMLEMSWTLVDSNKALSASRDLLLPRLISGQLSVEAAERELEDAA